ncbi:MAG: response regulator transcription factor [Bacteroidia bacterium]
MNILLADDHPMILQGTKSFLESLGYTISDLCSNGSVALSLIENHKPDVAILDINMPEMSGLEVAKQVQSKKLSCKIILLTMHNEKNIYKKALEYGVYGYLLKNFSSTEIDECLKTVAKNKPYTSPHLETELTTNIADSSLDQLSITERKIVELISQQKSNKQISEALFMSERTIEWHRRNIIDKLNLPKGNNTLLSWATKNVKV